MFIISCVLTPSLSTLVLLALVCYGGTLVPINILSRAFPLFLALGMFLVIIQQLFNIPLPETLVCGSRDCTQHAQASSDPLVVCVCVSNRIRVHWSGCKMQA
jgi:hypothetical protein